MYDRDSPRYFATTGQHVDGTPETVNEATEALAAVHARYFAPKDSGRKQGTIIKRTDGAPMPDDAQLLALARNAHNGAKFARLYDAGDCSGYASQSEADLALCSLLAFYAGPDPARIDRLYRASALYRDKWDEQRGELTYGEMTIAKVLDGRGPGDFYTAGHTDTPEEPDWLDGAPWPGHEPVHATAQSETRRTEPGTWADIGAQLGPIVWDWPGWLARGFVTLFAAETGKGKSSEALYVSGCYLEGWPWPDGTPFDGELGRVLWCEAEGAQALNVARCAAWGLDPTLIITPLGPLEDVNLMDNEHRRAIAHAARLDDVRLVVVDSLSGATAGHRDENSTEMLQVVKWLAALARDTAKPVIVTHHLRKKGLADGDGAITLDRLRGSSAIAQTARLVWALDTPDPATPDALRLSVIKSNLGRFPAPIGLEIRENGITRRGTPKAPVVVTDLDHAKNLIRAMLASGSVPAVDVQREAEARGISERTLNRAKSALYVSSRRVDSVWHWQPPAWMQTDTHRVCGNLDNVGTLGNLDTLGNIAKGAKYANTARVPSACDDGALVAAMTLSGGHPTPCAAPARPDFDAQLDALPGLF